MRSYLRAVKAHALRFQSVHRPIIVMGLRRGGTTMVSDAVACQPGIWFANEPYAVFPSRSGYDIKLQRLPTAKHSHFFDLSGHAAIQFITFSVDLLEARFRTMGTSRNTKFMLRADRVCLKELNAPWMIDWFRDTAKAHIIVVLRHPAAQALSVLRQGWGFPVEAYLERPEALLHVFTPAQIDAAQAIFAEKDPWSIAILDWVVTSHPLRHASGPRVYRCSYENIVEDHTRFVDEVLIKACGLSQRDAMLDALAKPSGSSAMSSAQTKDLIVQGDSRAIIERWKSQITAEQAKTGQRILEIFGVTDYLF